jgi:hypothetical protein
MDQPVLFCGGEGRGDLLCNPDGGTRIERPGAVNAFIKGLALDQFHGVKILACLKAHPELVDSGDVLVSQCCSGARFAEKAFTGVGTSLSDASFNDL